MYINRISVRNKHWISSLVFFLQLTYNWKQILFILFIFSLDHTSDSRGKKNPKSHMADCCHKTGSIYSSLWLSGWRRVILGWHDFLVHPWQKENFWKIKTTELVGKVTVQVRRQSQKDLCWRAICRAWSRKLLLFSFSSLPWNKISWC